MIEDTPFDDLVSDLAIGPVGNGASRLAGSLAGHGDDGADLLGRNARSLTRAGRIAEAVLDTQLGQGDRLEEHPAFPPKPDRLQTDVTRAGDGQVTPTRGGIQDDLSTHDGLLGGRVLSDQRLQGDALIIGQHDGHGLGATHDCVLARDRGLR